MMDRMHLSGVSSSVIRSSGRALGALVLAVVVAACGGGAKNAKTTPGKGKGNTDTQSMKDGVDPTDPAGTGGSGGGATAGADGVVGTPDDLTGAGAGSAADPADPTGAPVIAPNLDPDPAQAKVQVDRHLTVARAALSLATPDAETALREARLALSIDAASVDAAAMVAFAYYHKRLYDTAELVLDDLYKRDTAKNNANVNYVYGLIYDKTNRPERALLAYQKAVGIDPNHQSALVNLGVHQLKNSQYDAAVQTFEQLTQQFNRTDAVTLTSLGSAYRGKSADYGSGSGDRNGLVGKAEAQYKRALQANTNYGPAYYNLGLLYLDNDPFPGIADPIVRLNAAKAWFDQYKNMPGFDIKLYDERMKDVTKALKRAQKKTKKKPNPS